MEIIKKRIADMERAEYNPRVELMPGDDEYEKLKRNIDRFGVVVPVIWNKRTNRVVSGHQRLTVLMNEGVTETDVSVVDLDETAEKDYKSLLTYCSIHSPQAPITAAVARANGMPCRIVYGGTTRESVAALPMPRLAMKYGASIVLAARSGRHSILHARAKELAAQENSFIVQYGINIIGYGDTLLTAVAAQTENLPDDIENLVMTCGSGITATGVIIGLHRYGKRVKRMHLVATAPDRRGFIHETLKKYGADREFEYHDLFHSPGFIYEKSAAATWGGIRLHPHYEAKTMQWFRSSGIAPESTLFWITGAEPRSPGQS